MSSSCRIAIVGGRPAGLAAAHALTIFCRESKLSLGAEPQNTNCQGGPS